MLVHKCKYDIPESVLECLEFRKETSHSIYFSIRAPFAVRHLPTVDSVVIGFDLIAFGKDVYNNPFNNK